MLKERNVPYCLKISNKETLINNVLFISVPFMIMGMKWLDCVHDVDRSISAKKNRMEKNKMVHDVCSFVIIKTNLTELDRNVVSLLCSWNKIAHFKERDLQIWCIFIFYSNSFYYDTSFVCICMYMSMYVSLCVFVCVCVCLQVFISFHSKKLFLSKMTSGTYFNIHVNRTLADLRL